MLAAFAGPDNDITFPALMGFYRQNDPTLLSRGATLKMYDQVLQDPHALAELGKRARTINAFTWDVKPGGTSLRDKKAAEAIKEQLSNLRLSQIREEMLIAELVYGFQVGEAMWERDDDRIVLTDILARDQIRFNMDDQYRIRLRTMKDMVIGEHVPPRKFVWSTYDRRNNGPYGRGLGAVLWWPCHFKRILKGFWLDYADKFTTQSVIGTSPEGATPEMQEKVLAAAEAIANGAKAAALPAGATLTGLESKRAATEAVFAKFIEYLDEEMSKAINGEAMTTSGSTHSSKAAGQAHQDVNKILATSDAARSDTTFNTTVIPWLTEFNHPGAKPPKLVTDTKDAVDLKKAAEVVAVLASAGWKRKKEWMETTFGGEFEEAEAAASEETPDDTSKGSPVGAGSAQVNVNAAAEAKR